MDGVVVNSLFEKLCLQQEEVDMLQAVFPGANEMVWDDPTLLMDVEEYISSSGKSPHNVRFLSFHMNIQLLLNEPHSGHKVSLRISVSLPSSYPDVHPIMSVISNELARKKQSELNEDLMKYMATLGHGEVILLNLVTWVQENVAKYYSVVEYLKVVSAASETVEELLSMWLYMHHIYNKEKRKNIIHWAEDLSLTGFSLPGKPGVVYVEGCASNVEQYFHRLRQLSWKRMCCKVKEKCEKKVFPHFAELAFQVHGTRENHMDMGKFFSFLKENKLGHMFKVLFGVEGHG